MNLTQRNPSDPKHREFHDGEHEYNPAHSKVKAGSAASFSAKSRALVYGLELVTAVAAVIVVVAVLANLYVNTSPVSIGHDGAVLNIAVEDNPDGLPVSYMLTPEADDGTVIAMGVLADNSTTLRLEGLQPDTPYILTYYTDKGEGMEKISSYRFVTGQLIQNPIPEATTAVTTTPIPTTPVPTTPVPTTPEPTTPAPTTPEPTTPAPTTPEPTTPAPEPTALDSKLSSASYIAPESGELHDGKYKITQRFSFTNIPEGEYTVSAATSGGTALKYTSKIEDNILYVYVERTIYAGHSYTSEVTVTWANGASCSSSHTVRLSAP